MSFPGLACRAVPMVHHPAQLASYGYRITRGARSIAYSGDTAALEPVADLAQDADVLIVECTNLDGHQGDHLSVRDIAELRERLPARTRIWVTHTQGATQAMLPDGTTLLEDFQTETL